MADNPLSGGSVWSLAGKPTVELKDPNTILRDAASTQNLLIQNRAGLANEARGNALAQAVDPVTGRVDTAAYNRNLAGNPLAAMAVAAGVDQSQSLSTQQTDLGIKRNNYVASQLASVLNAPDDQIHASAVAALQRAVQAGVMPMDRALAEAAMLPNDASRARSYLNQVQKGLLSPEAQRGAIYGTPGTRDNGSTIEGGVVAPADSATPGAFLPSGSAPRQLSPSERTAPTQTGVTPGGAPIYGQRQDFIGATGGDKGAPGGRLGSGRYPGLPGSLENPNRRQPAAPAATGLPPAAPENQPIPMPGGGGVVTGLGPAQQAALTSQGGDSAKGFQAITDQGVQARSQSATLGTMLADTAHFDPGQGWNEWRKAYVKNAPSWAPSFGITPESVAANESFDKFANQLAGAQGAGSDARLAVAQGANPSSKMSKEGVDQVLRQLQGNADYLQARQQLAAKHPNPADLSGFEAGTGRQLDPRAFQVYRMTPAQRQSYDRGLSDTDRQQVRAAYKFAHDNGLFTAPAAAAAPAPAAPAPSPAAPARRGY